jgi:hypothetical protein
MGNSDVTLGFYFSLFLIIVEVSNLHGNLMFSLHLVS